VLTIWLRGSKKALSVSLHQTVSLRVLVGCSGWQAIAHQMIVLQQQGLLLQSETNLIGESLLVLGSAAG
jgi:hypothetical protein